MTDTGLVPLFEQKFTNFLELKLQQGGSKLRRHVNESSMTGAKLASPVNHMGAVAMKAPTGRYAPKENTPQVFTRRWVAPVDRELDQYFDTFDELKTQVDPKSPAVTNASHAAGRFIDDQIIVAATAASTIGPDAGSLTTETFDTAIYKIADNFGASAAVGLTVKKLNEGRRVLEKYHNDLMSDPAVLIIGSQQHSDLRDQAQVVSSDFNRNGGVLTDGQVTRFMGFAVEVMERLPIIATNTRGCLLIVKSGLHLGVWKDMQTRMFQRGDLSGNPWDINTMISVGATRTQLGKVIQIACKDTTGADINP